MSHENGEFISPISTRLEKDNSSRMILNLQRLNQYVGYHRFKMESFSTVVAMVKPNCLIASVDLKDAFLSVPIAHEP